MRLDMVATVVGIGMLGYLVYTQLSPTNRLQQHAVVTNEQGQKTAGPTSKGAPIKAGQLDPNGIKLMHNTTGNKINMERGTDHRNGQRYNVNHRFTQYLSIGYYKIGKGQKIINHKTDGPNHGGCTQLPRCTWLEPQIELSSGKQVLNTEHPHPQGHDNRPCPSCKTVGAISAGQWLGWGVAAYGPEGARTVEAWVDKGGLVGGTKPANQWVE